MSDLDFLRWSSLRWSKTTPFRCDVCLLDTTLTVPLASVFRKNDGRWTWIRLNSKWYPQKRQNPIQGVCDTKEEAMKMALADIPEVSQS